MYRAEHFHSERLMLHMLSEGQTAISKLTPTYDLCPAGFSFLSAEIYADSIYIGLLMHHSDSEQP